MQNKHYIHITKNNVFNIKERKDELFGEIYTYRLNDLWDFKEVLCSLDSLIVQPQYLTEEIITIANEKNIQCLYLEDRLCSNFFQKENENYLTLTNLSFLEKITNLKCFKMDAYTSFFLDKPIIKIDDYTPIEKLHKLESIYIPDRGEYPIFVDIDFSKLNKLKEVNLQYPKNNQSIYHCENIESIHTRYYESDLLLALNWKKLKRFDAYFDKLKNFNGLNQFEFLEEFKGEFTSSIQNFEEISSTSIQIFYYYTEAKKAPITLEGISGLENVELLALSGLKKLESIADLVKCKKLKELRLENSSVPNDIEKITEIKSLERIVVDNPDKVEKDFPILKSYLM